MSIQELLDTLEGTIMDMEEPYGLRSNVTKALKILDEIREHIGELR